MQAERPHATKGQHRFERRAKRTGSLYSQLPGMLLDAFRNLLKFREARLSHLLSRFPVGVGESAPDLQKAVGLPCED